MKKIPSLRWPLRSRFARKKFTKNLDFSLWGKQWIVPKLHYFLNCTAKFFQKFWDKLHTPGPSSRDQQLWNEPAKPITNSNKWIVVHVNWPKWKSYDKDFFNWIKIADFHKVIDCFLELFRISLQKTINYFIKICNFDPIKKALVIWFSFGPFYSKASV